MTTGVPLLVFPAWSAGIQMPWMAVLRSSWTCVQRTLFKQSFHSLGQSFHSACGRAGNFSLLVQRKVTKRNHVKREHAPGGASQKLCDGTKVPCTTRSFEIDKLLASLLMHTNATSEESEFSTRDDRVVQGTFIPFQLFVQLLLGRARSGRVSWLLLCTSKEVTRAAQPHGSFVFDGRATARELAP